MKNEFTVRTAVVYLIALAVAWILTEVVWGATGGLVGGLFITRNPEYQQKAMSFWRERGVDTQSDAKAVRHAYRKLSTADQRELMKLSREALSDINWFYVTLFVSAVVFGLVGFLGGIFARGWLFAGVVPALSFLTNNPIIRFRMTKDLSTLQKAIVIVFAQFAVCYLLAYCGYRLALKRQQKKKTANQSLQPTCRGSAPPSG